MFFKWNPKDIRTNLFNKHTKPLWEANINAQFILDPYATSYYTSYLTKVNKIVDQEIHLILNKCKHEQTQASQCIKILDNAFLNAQQIFSQQNTYNVIKHFYHSTRSFQFTNTFEEQNRAFVLLPQKILQTLP